jgi:hypothetical protein
MSSSSKSTTGLESDFNVLLSTLSLMQVKKHKKRVIDKSDKKPAERLRGPVTLILCPTMYLLNVCPTLVFRDEYTHRLAEELAGCYYTIRD